MAKKIDPAAMARAATSLLKQQQQLRPVHIHQCPEGDHPWTCPSAYCEDVRGRPRRCPGHGGELPRDTSADDFSSEEG